MITESMKSISQQNFLLILSPPPHHRHLGILVEAQRDNATSLCHFLCIFFVALLQLGQRGAMASCPPLRAPLTANISSSFCQALKLQT